MTMMNERHIQALRLKREGMTLRRIGERLDPPVCATRARHILERAKELESLGAQWTAGLPERVARLLGPHFSDKASLVRALTDGTIHHHPRPGNPTAIYCGEEHFRNFGPKSLEVVCEWANVPYPKRTKKTASEETIKRAISLLERYGYKVVTP